MIDNIIKWSILNRWAVAGASLLLALYGAWLAATMPVDVFPDLTAPTVTILVDAHGMAPQEVETLVTFPIESAINGASGIRRVRSNTAIGFAVIYAEFAWGTDILTARQIVNERMQSIIPRLPEEVAPPVLAPVSSIMGEIMYIGVSSSNGDAMELRTVAEGFIRNRILSVPGIAQVSVYGGERKQYQVLLDPARLASYRLSPKEVADKVEQANENFSGGFLSGGSLEYVIHGIGRVVTEQDLEESFVAMRGGKPVLLGDVAEVRIASGIKRGDGSLQAAPAVVMGIQKQAGANTLTLTKALDQAFTEMQPFLPPGVSLHTEIFCQADFIQISVENVQRALVEGGILVVAIVILSLMNFWASIITLTAIPLSLAVTFVVLALRGDSINTMTLGGIAIAIGALVDDAIVDVENAVRRLRENWALPAEQRKPVLEIVYTSSTEIRSSIVFANVIITLVFLPILFLSGVEGRLLLPLGVAYIIGITASLAVAMTASPAFCAILVQRIVGQEQDPFVVRWLKALYRPLLSFFVRRWLLVGGCSLLAMGLAGYFGTMLGRSFLPEFNEGALTVSVVTLPGASIEESNRLGLAVERTLLRHPEVVSVARRTGRDESDEHSMAVNASEVEVKLAMRERSMPEFLDALRHDFEEFRGTNLIIGQPISHRIDHMLSGTRANIAVKLFGPDLYELRRLATQVQAVMSEIPGVVDLSKDEQADIPFVKILLNRRAIAQYGLTVADVAHMVEIAFKGEVVSQVVEGPYAFDLLVRLDPALATDADLLRQTVLVTPLGASVTLEQLAEVRRDKGPNSISRENVQRKMVVMCNVGGRDLAGVVADIRTAIREQVTFPQGYHVEYGGQFESAEEASRIIFWVSLFVVVAIFFMLAMAFRSVKDALLVIVNLPLALIGGVVGVFLTGGVMSIASMIGFITLFGVATRNGLLMVTHFRHLVEQEGLTDPLEVVLRGASERVTPIFMTAASTALALIPIALAAGEPGNEIQAPMAVVILGGMVSSTLLNMLVVPALYLRFGDAVSGLRR